MLISSLFSGPTPDYGSYATGPGAPQLGGPGGNLAGGTDYWRGGPTWVGERGPEIVNLPRGAQVIPFDQAKRAARRHRDQRQRAAGRDAAVGDAGGAGADARDAAGVRGTTDDLPRHPARPEDHLRRGRRAGLPHRDRHGRVRRRVAQCDAGQGTRPLGHRLRRAAAGGVQAAAGVLPHRARPRRHLALQGLVRLPGDQRPGRVHHRDRRQADVEALHLRRADLRLQDHAAGQRHGDRDRRRHGRLRHRHRHRRRADGMGRRIRSPVPLRHRRDARQYHRPQRRRWRPDHRLGRDSDKGGARREGDLGSARQRTSRCRPPRSRPA